MSTRQQQTPAGWYPNGDVQRYWDGHRWTEQTAPLHASATPRSPAGDGKPGNGFAPSSIGGDHGPTRKKKPVYLRWWFLALAAVVVIAILGSALGGGGDSVETTTDRGGSTTALPSPTQPAKKKATTEPAQKAPGIGTPVRDGKFEFTVTKVTKGKNRVGSADFGKSAQGQFIYVYVTVKNTGDEAQTLFGDNQTLVDAKGRKFTPDTEAAIYLDESQSFIEDINPGNQLKGVILFDVPKDAVPTTIELHDSAFSGGTDVALT